MHVRKILTFVDEARREAGETAQPPLRKVAAVAVVRNPFAGRFVRDLAELTEASAAIGREISTMAVALLKPYAAESYGKGAIIGLAGEQEHGVAMLTTVFGNVMRDAAGGGKAWISSMTKRAGPGASIDIPLAHKDALYVRSHYDGITLTLPAVQRSREVWLVVSGAAKADAVAAAIGGAKPVDVPAAGAVGRQATVWLLDEDAAAKL